MEPMSTVDFAEPSGALTALDVALDGLANEHLSTVPRHELGARCVSLQHARQRLDAIIATGIAEAERAGVAVLAGQRTRAHYLASRTHASRIGLRPNQPFGPRGPKRSLGSPSCLYTHEQDASGERGTKLA